MSDRRGWGAMIMMMVPVAIFAFLALRARPKPNVVVPDAEPFRISIVGAESLNLTPLEASKSYGTSNTDRRGLDTKLRMKLKMQGRPFLGPTNYEYTASCSIVSDASTKKGKDEISPLYSIGNLRSYDDSPAQFPEFAFYLRNIPLSRGALRARFSFSITAPLASGLYGFSVKKEIVVRAKGQKTPAPKVSIDPLFDIEKIEILPYKSVQKGDNDNARLILHIAYRGPLGNSAPNVSKTNSFYLDIFDSHGYYFSARSGAGFVITQDKNRRYRFEQTLEVRPNRDSKMPFVLKGWLSINKRWPRRFRVVVPRKISG